MKVRLNFFSTLRDRLGASEREIEVEKPQEARDIFFALFEDSSLAERLIRSTRFAVNCEYVSPETIIKEGDELAFIPPVSGG